MERKNKKTKNKNKQQKKKKNGTLESAKISMLAKLANLSEPFQ